MEVPFTYTQSDEVDKIVKDAMVKGNLLAVEKNQKIDSIKGPFYSDEPDLQNVSVLIIKTSAMQPKPQRKIVPGDKP